MPDPRRVTRESRYLALLRGVNVGKGPRVPMAEWRALLQAQGYREVQTLLNSGNAVFSADGGSAESHAAAISATLAAQLSLRLHVIVLSAERLQRVIAGWPFDLDRIAASQTLIAMTQHAEDLLALQRIEPLIRPDEQWTIGNEAAYFASTTGLADSKAANVLLSLKSVPLTTRNAATLLKLQALLDGAGAH